MMMKYRHSLKKWNVIHFKIWMKEYIYIYIIDVVGTCTHTHTLNCRCIYIEKENERERRKKHLNMIFESAVVVKKNFWTWIYQCRGVFDELTTVPSCVCKKIKWNHW